MGKKKTGLITDEVRELINEVARETASMAYIDGMGGENYGQQPSFTAASEMQALTGKPKLFYQTGGK